MGTATYTYEDLSSKVLAALRKEFPTETVYTHEGYRGRVHVLVVSSKLNGMSEAEKQAYIWELLQTELGLEAQGVSLAIAYGTDELM
jgi:stress-induced morphogen